MVQRPRVAILPALALAGLAISACQPATPPPDHAAAQRPVVDAFLAAWNTGAVDALDEAMVPEVRRFSPGGASDAGNLEELKQVVLDLRTAYPDMRITLDDMYSLENLAFGFWTFTGTNTGSGAMPPTGASVRISGLTMLRFAGGKITEERAFFDNADWLTQLGYTMQAPAQAQPVQ